MQWYGLNSNSDLFWPRWLIVGLAILGNQIRRQTLSWMPITTGIEVEIRSAGN